MPNMGILCFHNFSQSCKICCKSPAVTVEAVLYNPKKANQSTLNYNYNQCADC